MKVENIDWDNKENISEMLWNDDNFFRDNAPKEISDNKEYMCSLIEFFQRKLYFNEISQNIFPYVSERLRDDKVFVLYCLGFGCSLSHVSERLRDCTKVVKLALINNFFDIDFVSERIRKIAESESVIRTIEEIEKREIPF